MLTLQLLAFAILILGIPGISGFPGILAVPAPGRSPLEHPAPTRLPPRRHRSLDSPPSSLHWEPFHDHIPSHAVSNWNHHSQRLEFICSTRMLGCNLGAYSPERGPFCFFSWAELEMSSPEFQLLVNPAGFEALDWVDSSFGSIPEGAVEGCPLTDVFVGRSRDGLGKISREQQALFVAVDGEEIWYKWYQTLVVRQGQSHFFIGNVSYNASAAWETLEPAEVAEVAVRNPECQAIPKSLSLEEATEVEHGWSAELPEARGVLHVAPPIFTESGWEFGNITTIPWAGGATLTEFMSRVHEVREEIPARSECSVVLRGVRRDVRIPFSAWLTREFRSGHQHRVAVAGWVRSQVVTGVRAGLERCRAITELPPCPD